MSNTNNSSSSGIDFCGLLTILFITLKLCHVIDWSWWWVTSPLWIPFAVIASFMVVRLVCILGSFAWSCVFPVKRIHPSGLRNPRRHR